MNKILNHDSIATGVWNLGFSSSSHTVWEGHLVNTEESLVLLAARFESDYVALAPKMRKALKTPEVVAWSRSVFSRQIINLTITITHKVKWGWLLEIGLEHR